jgi:hypothetical protein
VLLSIEKVRERSGQPRNSLQVLARPEAAAIDFDIERAKDLPRAVDLS